MIENAIDPEKLDEIGEIEYALLSYIRMKIITHPNMKMGYEEYLKSMPKNDEGMRKIIDFICSPPASKQEE